VITFQVEPWDQFWPYMGELNQAHWLEVATNQDVIKLKVDFVAYRHFENTGQLHVVTVRKDGELAGYHISIVRPHLHYRDSLTAYTDVYFIVKGVRNYRTFSGLLDEVERTLAKRGVQKMFTGTKRSLNMGPIFVRKGWTHSEDTYIKLIGN
jgi:hypothetical protein